MVGFSLILVACGQASGDGKIEPGAALKFLPQIPFSVEHSRVLSAAPREVALFVDMVGGPPLTNVGEHGCIGSTYPWSPWRKETDEIVVPERDPMPNSQPVSVARSCLRLPANLRAIDLMRLLIGMDHLAPVACQGNLLIACCASGGEAVWVQADGLRWKGPQITLRWSGGELDGQQIRIAVLAPGPNSDEVRLRAIGSAEEIVGSEDELWAALPNAESVPPNAMRRSFRLVVEAEVTLGSLLSMMLRLEEACQGEADVGIRNTDR